MSEEREDENDRIVRQLARQVDQIEPPTYSTSTLPDGVVALICDGCGSKVTLSSHECEFEDGDESVCHGCIPAQVWDIVRNLDSPPRLRRHRRRNPSLTYRWLLRELGRNAARGAGRVIEEVKRAKAS